MYSRALIIVLFEVVLIVLSQIIVPSRLVYPLMTLPSNVIDLPAINLSTGHGSNITVTPHWTICLEGSGEFTYDALGYCVIYFYNGTAEIVPYNSFKIPFLSHMNPKQISKAYYWTYSGYTSNQTSNETLMYKANISAQILIICYYDTLLSQSELKNVMLATFNNISVAVLGSEKIYYYYANNGTYAKFVDIIGSHIIVVINYPSEGKGDDLMYYYKDPVSILLQLTYNVYNYMKNTTSS